MNLAEFNKGAHRRQLHAFCRCCERSRHGLSPLSSHCSDDAGVAAGALSGAVEELPTSSAQSAERIVPRAAFRTERPTPARMCHPCRHIRCASVLSRPNRALRITVRNRRATARGHERRHVGVVGLVGTRGLPHRRRRERPRRSATRLGRRSTPTLDRSRVPKRADVEALATRHDAHRAPHISLCGRSGRARHCRARQTPGATRFTWRARGALPPGASASQCA